MFIVLSLQKPPILIQSLQFSSRASSPHPSLLSEDSSSTTLGHTVWTFQIWVLRGLRTYVLMTVWSFLPKAWVQPTHGVFTQREVCASLDPACYPNKTSSSVTFLFTTAPKHFSVQLISLTSVSNALVNSKPHFEPFKRLCALPGY